MTRWLNTSSIATFSNAALSIATLSTIALVASAALPALAQGGGQVVAGGSTAPVRAEVFIVLAREAEGVIDPALAGMPALRRAPFNAFHSMEVLARPELQLTPEQAIDVPLPNGRALRIELQGTTADGRYRVRVSINTPGQSDYLPLLQVVSSPGDPFFVAGQNWLGGTLVIGVRIGQRPVARKV